MKLFAIIASAAALAGCTEFPDLDAAISDRARALDYPQLIPAEQIAAERKAPARLTPQDGDALLARAQRLRARGAILRGVPTIDEATRQRISARLTSLGG